MEKAARKLQRKITTTVEKVKLDTLKEDVLQLKGIIAHTENIIALSVSNMEILRQSTSGNFGSKETLFGWHVDDTDRKEQAVLSVIILLTSTKSSM